VHYYKYWQALLLVAIFEKQNDRRNTIVWAIYIEVRWRIWLPEQRKESNAVLQLIHLQVMNNALFFLQTPHNKAEDSDRFLRRTFLCLGSLS
jgi:hypothetical protein